MGDWDDSDEDDFAAAAPSPSAHDPFGGENEDSDDGGNWDDSSEEEQEQEAGLARVPSQGDGKSAKQLAREKKERQRKAATARLKAERMELAIRAGRTLVAATAAGAGGGAGAGAAAAPEPAAADTGAIGPVDADGVERRTDPSDGVGYTFAEFEEAYAERAQELWDLAGRIMLGESGTLGAVQQDSDMLFGGDDAGDGAGGDAPQDGPATLDSVLKYDLMSEQEFGAAADRLVNKFEQLIVSDNFVPFLGQWAVRAMQDAKADRVSELMSAPPPAAALRCNAQQPLTRGRGQARSRGPRTPRRSWSAPPARRRRRRRPPRRPPRRSRHPRRRLPPSRARRRRRTTPR